MMSYQRLQSPFDGFELVSIEYFITVNVLARLKNQAFR